MNFNNEKKNVIIMSIIWGFGLSMLFRKICNNNGNCVIIKNKNEISN